MWENDLESTSDFSHVNIFRIVGLTSREEVWRLTLRGGEFNGGVEKLATPSSFLCEKMFLSFKLFAASFLNFTNWTRRKALEFKSYKNAFTCDKQRLCCRIHFLAPRLLLLWQNKRMSFKALFFVSEKMEKSVRGTFQWKICGIEFH